MNFRSVFSKILNVIKAVVLNKYLIVLVVFGVYITFFDHHNLVNRWRLNGKIKELNEEYKYYQNEIDKNKNELYRLQNDNQYLEKYAREKYLMHNKGEEVFIIKNK